jgi:glycosyltransferase involved in cell wall biosynthesis
MPRILPCLDLLVHPATMEGLGVSLIQAAAAGVPVVAARAGGIPEVVAHGENGLLVPPEDPDALREAVAALLADPARAGAMGRRGRERAARLFSVDGMVEGNMAVYRRVLSQRGGWPVAGGGGGQKV